MNTPHVGLPNRRPAPRRGVALLLVLVVTGTAAGLGAMQLASGSAAPHVAANRERVAIEIGRASCRERVFTAV